MDAMSRVEERWRNQDWVGQDLGGRSLQRERLGSLWGRLGASTVSVWPVESGTCGRDGWVVPKLLTRSVSSLTTTTSELMGNAPKL